MPEYFHDSVAHSRGEYVREDVHINGMESFSALIKRGHKGVYHNMSRMHIHRYVAEFSARYNSRALGTRRRMELAALGKQGQWLPWKRLTMCDRLQGSCRGPCPAPSLSNEINEIDIEWTTTYYVTGRSGLCRQSNSPRTAR